MAIHDLTLENLDYHRDRIGALTADSERLWGELTVERMMRHLRLITELSIDDPDGKVKPIAPPVIRHVIGWLFFDVFTHWPKGKMKALPLYLPEQTLPFQEEQTLLLEVCRKFAEACAADPNALHVHPVTGRAKISRIAHIHGVHMNHHYRQFGLV